MGSSVRAVVPAEGGTAGTTAVGHLMPLVATFSTK